MSAQPNKTFEKIREFLAKQPDIRLGIVFGSLAKGRAGRDSDLDIALLGDQPLKAKRCKQLIETLAQLSGRPVDLVDLMTAGVPIARSAVLGGQVIFSRSSEVYPAQVSRVLIDSADFLPYRTQVLKERCEAWIQ
jgi:predicted nucleotidyltransferase